MYTGGYVLDMGIFITLMIGTDMVPEMENFNHFTWLMA
jgi:hypothetical protein